MPKPSSSATNHHDDDDPDLNNSTSTNAALLPAGTANNGYLWGKHNSNSLLRAGTTTNNEDDVRATPLSTAEAGGGCGNASNSRSDLVLTELGHPSTRVEIRGGGGGGSRHESCGGGVQQSKTKSCCYYWREYRCQIILLVAFIEFAILIAGVTFYSAGVLTATCDNTAAAGGRQGKPRNTNRI